MTNQINAKDFGRVAVLMGGTSAEREVSLNSGMAVFDALKRCSIDAVALDVKDDVISVLQEQSFDRVFIVLHGRGGEDGCLQGALELLGLPYTGSGVQASAIGMDKYRTKLLWKALGLPTPDFYLMSSVEDIPRVLEMGFPVMIKPVHEGSSIGMAKVESQAQLMDAYREASEFDSQVMAEKWVVGEEYTAAILAHEVLPIIRLETPNSFYDYEAKYQLNTTSYHCPCGLDDEAEAALKKLVTKAFQAIGGKAWGRVDLFLDEQNQPWLIEVNTVPGMTDHSLVPMAAKQADISFDQLVWSILAETL